ncbi:MAG: EamA family transporter [Betaproteobacteria bacterium]
MTQTVALIVTCLCVAMIAAGQVLFKLVALRSAAAPEAGLMAHWLNWPFVVALAIYGAATLLWIWVLRYVPLNIAYPVFALAFVIVPVASYVVFREPLGWHHALGGAMIVAGVLVISLGARA